MPRRLVACLLGLSVIVPVHAEKPPPDEVKAEPPAKIRGTKKLPPLPEGAFTFVVIPDTQHYTGKGTKVSKGNAKQAKEPVRNGNLEAQVEWILANQKAQNIVFVSHVGDIVEYDRKQEWAVAKQHLDRLRGVVPFSLTVGNHDMSSKGDAHLFQEVFPAASFKDYPWYAGAYAHDREDQRVSANNVNSAQLFSAGGVDFIHLSLECNAPDDVLAWADGVLTKNAARRAIITTHMDLGILDKPKEQAGYIKDPKGRMKWVKIHGERGNTGEQMWDKLYRKHANLLLVLCGDQSRVTALRLDRAADDGHIIHGLLSDYMSEPALRLMRFLPREERIDVLTYEVKKDFLVDDTNYVHAVEQHQFSLPWVKGEK